MEENVQESGDMTLEEALAVYNNPSLESLPNEEWAFISDYPNYMISNLGRVKKNAYVHYHKDGRVFHYKSVIKKQTVKEDGYMVVRLFNEDELGHSEGRMEKTHRLIAKAFIPNPQNKPFIDHINTVRHDNRIENLRWCTKSENSNNPITLERTKELSRKRWLDEKQVEHARKMSKIKFSDPIFMEKFKKRMNDADVKDKMRKTSCCKKVEVIKDGAIIGQWFSANECERQTGIAQALISRWCLSGKTNKKGEFWRYAE